jgi:hypothetical protein
MRTSISPCHEALVTGGLPRALRVRQPTPLARDGCTIALATSWDEVKFDSINEGLTCGGCSTPHGMKFYSINEGSACGGCSTRHGMTCILIHDDVMCGELLGEHEHDVPLPLDEVLQAGLVAGAYNRPLFGST